MTIDPNEFDISELGPKLRKVEDVDELEAIHEAETSGQNRDPVKTLIQSRIDKLTEDAADTDDAVDPTELTLAELGNAIRRIDDVGTLESLLEVEKEGDDRKGAREIIQKRIDSISEEDEEATDIVHIPPEEKYPDLDHPTEDKQYVKALAGGEYRDMWVYCETQQDELLDVTKEMLGKARKLIDTYNDEYGENERVVGILIGDKMSQLVGEVIAYGADIVLLYEDARLERFLHKPYTEIFATMARCEADWKGYDEPRYTLFPATNNGRDLSALVQGELDSGLASDCSDLYIENTLISNPAKTGRPGEKKEFDRVLHMKRPDFSGFEYSTILCIDNPHRDFHPQGASVIPGSFEIPEPNGEREGETIKFELEMPEEWFQVQITDHDVLDEGVDITGHDVIVCVGRGIGNDPTRGIELALDLVDVFDDAELGLTRGVVTASYQVDSHVEQYITEERQIGETGVVVEPELYIAIGVSGAIQHKVGMDESETIITINTDPDARIRDFSDYYIEGDLFDVLPRLTEAMRDGTIDIEPMAAGGSE